MRRDINIIMKISIIVPVYNAEKTIEYCIDSIITQKTKFEIELILVEDYSTDRSYEICLALKKKYTEIKLYRTNGKGVSAARNTGLSHSTAHNVYIQVLCEMGIIGFVLYTGAIILLLKYTIKALKYFSKTQEYQYKYAAMLSFCFQIFYLLYSLSGNCLYDI